MNEKPSSADHWSESDADWLEDQVDKFERAWSAGNPPSLEETLEPVDDPRRRIRLARELALIDLERRWMDSRPTLADYARRIPEILEDGLLTDEMVRYEADVREQHGDRSDFTGVRPIDIADGESDSTDDQLTHDPLSNRGGAPSFDKLPVTIGRFQLVELVGEGAFGSVFRALDSQLGRVVAVKVPHAGPSMSPDERKRFLREAQTAAALRHPAIVAVHEAFTIGGVPVIVSDFVQGETLAELLHREPIQHRYAAELTASLAEAIEYAHQQQILHRDVKPGNILIDADGKPHLTDFGLARRELDDSQLTIEGQVLGTPAYMPPEQALGKLGEIGPQSDVYSAGAVLYQALTRQRPYAGEAAAVINQVANDDPPAPRQLDRTIPRDLEIICLKAMRRSPKDRYLTAGELAADLRRFLRDDPITARPESQLARLRRWRRRHPAMSTAIATTLLAGLAVVLFWWTRPGRLTVVVDPPEAEVRVAQQRFTIDGEALNLELPVGVYELVASAPNYEPVRRVVQISRNKGGAVKLELRRETGTVLAECFPAGAEMIVDGQSFGSRIPRLTFPTGRREFLVQADNHFSQSAAFDLGKKQPIDERFWLDRGVLWTHRTPWLQAASIAVGDINGDGIPDISHMTLSNVAIFSGVDGEILMEHPVESANLAWFGTLPHGPEHEVLAVADPQDGGGTVTVYPRRNPSNPLWQTKLDLESRAQDALQLNGVADLNNDAIHEVVVVTSWSKVLLLDGLTGKILRTLDFGPAGAIEITSSTTISADSNRVIVIFNTTREGQKLRRVVCLEFAAKDARVVWEKPLPNAQQVTLVANLDQQFDIEWRSTERWELLDGDTGQSLLQRPAPSIDPLKADYQFNFGKELRRVRRSSLKQPTVARTWGDEPTEWRGPANLHPAQRVAAGNKLWQFSDDAILLRADGALQAVTADTGEVLWRYPHDSDSYRLADLDADGSYEVLAVVDGLGLVCLDNAGRELWTLKLPVNAGIYSMLPDLDGDGLQEILLFKHAAFLSVVRVPRVLWRTMAAGALQATPQVAEVDQEPGLDVVQLGPWHNQHTLSALRGRNGALIWDTDHTVPPNRAPVISDLGGVGRQSVFSLGHAKTMPGLSLLVQDVRNGETQMIVKASRPEADSYATPVIADFDGDGKLEVASQQYEQSHVSVFGGDELREIWTQPLPAPSFGGGVACDVDGDGVDDLIATCSDGRLYAFSGRDGEQKWATKIGFELRARPAVDTTQSPPRILMVALDETIESRRGRSTARLVVVNAHNGDIIDKLGVPGATESFGPPVVAKTPNGVRWAASLGDGGVAVWDSVSLEQLWTLTPVRSVISGVAVADIDRDGLWEVAAASRDGRLIVADLESGALLWDIGAATQEFEADVVVVDLNQDGAQDFLLANHDFSLAAVSGRNIAASRRMRKRPLPLWLRSTAPAEERRDVSK